MPTRTQRFQLRSRRVTPAANPRAIMSRSTFVPPQSRNTPLPNSITCRMRYVGQFTLNPAIGSPTFYQFSANGLYDPDITGSGHQPNGFDQMMALYNHYEVLSSTIKFTVYNDASTVFNMGVKLDDSGTLASTGPETVWELNLCNWKAVASQGAVVPVVTHRYDSRQFFGTPRATDRETWGDAGANPVDQAYFLCILGPPTAGSDLGNTACIAEIDYYVRLHEPKDLPSS